MNFLFVYEFHSVGRRKFILQPTQLTRFIKRPRVEEISHKSIVCNNDESAIGGNTTIVDGNLDLNLAIEKGSFEHQLSYIGEDSFQIESKSNHIIHKQSHMPMLNLLAIKDGDKSLTTKECGF